MPLARASCTNCGVTLPVDSAKDAAVCSYCGAAFVVEKAINKYNAENAHKTAQTSDVTAQQSKASDFRIDGGRLTEYKGNDKKVVIPNIVKIIKCQAFNDNLNIESVVIPDSVEEMQVDVGQTWTRGTFHNCPSLKDVYIGSGIKILHKDSFFGCYDLANITFQGNVSLVGGEVSDSIYRATYDYRRQKISECSNYLDGLQIPKDIDLLSFNQIHHIMDLFQKNGYSYKDTEILTQVDCFINGINIRKVFEKLEARERQENAKRWKAQGLCEHCGGKISSWSNKCKNCGKVY